MAFSILVPDSVISASHRTSLTSKMGNRQNGSDGTEIQQLFGVIGQNMVLQALGKPMMEPSNRHDGGIDFEIFGKRVDIKTMGRNVPPRLDFVNNFMVSQMAFNVDVIMFASINRMDMRFSLCGWIPKENLLQRAVLHKKGSTRTRDDQSTFIMKADSFEIPNYHLHYSATNWADLFVEIHQWACLGKTH